MIIKYGKPMKDVLSIKQDFFEDNDVFLQNNLAVAEYYSRQPLRKKCKLCDNGLDSVNDVYFTSHSVKYVICKNCSHINGIYDDTREFSEYLYKGSDYGQAYYSGNKAAYDNRLTAIYLPKAQFLSDSLYIGGGVIINI